MCRDFERTTCRFSFWPKSGMSFCVFFSPRKLMSLLLVFVVFLAHFLACRLVCSLSFGLCIILVSFWVAEFHQKQAQSFFFFPKHAQIVYSSFRQIVEIT